MEPRVVYFADFSPVPDQPGPAFAAGVPGAITLADEDMVDLSDPGLAGFLISEVDSGAWWVIGTVPDASRN